MKFEVVAALEAQDDEDETLLSVAGFAAQDEIDKHPSQVYGWMKKGLPVVFVDGVKKIPWNSGLAWFQEWQEQSKQQKRKTATKRHGPKPVRRPIIEVGQFIRWNRGNQLGPAYGIIREVRERMIWISGEYRTRTLCWNLADLESEIQKGIVTIVSSAEVSSFLLEEFSRVDFLACMVAGPKKARELKDAILGAEVLPLDFVERFHEDEHRTGHMWPTDEQLLEEINENKDN